MWATNHYELIFTGKIVFEGKIKRLTLEPVRRILNFTKKGKFKSANVGENTDQISS